MLYTVHIVHRSCNSFKKKENQTCNIYYISDSFYYCNLLTLDK